MITFHNVSWEEYFADPALWSLWSEHYAEFEFTHEHKLLFGPYIKGYEALWAAGQLEIIVARKDSVMIGYCLMNVRRHMHYDAICGFEDSLFLTKPERRGGIGLKLIEKATEACCKRGCKRIYFTTKAALSFAPLLEKLGFSLEFLGYCLWNGGA